MTTDPEMIDCLARIENKLDSVMEMLRGRGVDHQQPAQMGPSAMAFLNGGVPAVRELNKKMAAAQRAVKRKNKKQV